MNDKNEMSLEKESRKIKYTKMVLRDSLLELLKTYPVGKITVTQICKLADINRGTFYTYYENAEDLLHQIEEEMFAEIMQYIMALSPSMPFIEAVDDIMKYMFKNREFCGVLFSENGDTEFFRRVVDLIREDCIAYWVKNYDVTQERANLAFIFAVNGGSGIVKEWASGNLDIKPEELTKFLINIIANGIRF